MGDVQDTGVQNTDDQDTGDHDTSDQDTVLPWWQNPINLLSLAFAIAVLFGALGWVIGNNSAIDDPGPTDTGFLQDMRWHHEQAVEMANIYMVLPDTDQRLVTIAREIALGQAIEIGRMVEMLRNFGAAETNETETAMSWMGTPVPLDRMPGLATEADLQKFVRLSGDEADAAFVALMVAHHEGGVHMAEHAAAHAEVAEVRTMATQMAESQRREIEELQLLAAS
jgi:uncharacterized protein (DUF305 family)